MHLSQTVSGPMMQQVSTMMPGSDGSQRPKGSLSDIDDVNLNFEGANHDEIDRLLIEEAQGGDFDLDDADFETLLNDTAGANLDSGAPGVIPTQDLLTQQGIGQHTIMTSAHPGEHQGQPTLIHNGGLQFETTMQQPPPVVDTLQQMPIVEVQFDGSKAHRYNDPLIGESSSLLRQSVGDGALMNHTHQDAFTQHHITMEASMVNNVSVMQPNDVSTSGCLDLEAQKNYLLNKLKAVEQQKEQLAQQQQQNLFQVPGGGGFSLPQRQQQTTPFPAAQQQQQNRKFPLVASVTDIRTGGGESALSSFLRGSRKSHAMDGERTPPNQGELQSASSVLNNHVLGAPQAASIFNQPPMDLETIHSNQNSFANHSSTQDLFASVDRSNMTSSMVRNVPARTLMKQRMMGNRQGSGRKLMGSGDSENAQWGVDASASLGGSYSKSGILRKNASESALNKSLMRSRKLGSRDNLSVKRQGSGMSLNKHHQLNERSSENLTGLLPVRARSGGIKHQLGRSSRSVPHMGGIQRISSRPSQQQNAQW